MDARSSTGDGGTVRYALDQVQYEIELSAQHGDELRAALQTYIAHARKVARQGVAAPAASSVDRR